MTLPDSANICVQALARSHGLGTRWNDFLHMWSATWKTKIASLALRIADSEYGNMVEMLTVGWAIPSLTTIIDISKSVSTSGGTVISVGAGLGAVEHLLSQTPLVRSLEATDEAEQVNSYCEIKQIEASSAVAQSKAVSAGSGLTTETSVTTLNTDVRSQAHAMAALQDLSKSLTAVTPPIRDHNASRAKTRGASTTINKHSNPRRGSSAPKTLVQRRTPRLAGQKPISIAAADASVDKRTRGVRTSSGTVLANTRTKLANQPANHV